MDSQMARQQFERDCMQEQSQHDSFMAKNIQPIESESAQNVESNVKRCERRQWTEQEDKKLRKYVLEYDERNWTSIAGHMPGRHGKQCRQRWHNHLNPNINKQKWTRQEEWELYLGRMVYGKKWAEISTEVFKKRRTDNTLKNRWNSGMNRHKEQMSMKCVSIMQAIHRQGDKVFVGMSSTEKKLFEKLKQKNIQDIKEYQQVEKSKNPRKMVKLNLIEEGIKFEDKKSDFPVQSTLKTEKRKKKKRDDMMNLDNTPTHKKMNNPLIHFVSPDHDSDYEHIKEDHGRNFEPFIIHFSPGKVLDLGTPRLRDQNLLSMNSIQNKSEIFGIKLFESQFEMPKIEKKQKSQEKE